MTARHRAMYPSMLDSERHHPPRQGVSIDPRSPNFGLSMKLNIDLQTLARRS